MAHKEAGVGENIDGRFRLKGNWEPFGGRYYAFRREAIAKKWQILTVNSHQTFLQHLRLTCMPGKLKQRRLRFAKLKEDHLEPLTGYARWRKD